MLEYRIKLHTHSSTNKCTYMYTVYLRNVLPRGICSMYGRVCWCFLRVTCVTCGTQHAVRTTYHTYNCFTLVDSCMHTLLVLLYFFTWILVECIRLLSYFSAHHACTTALRRLLLLIHRVHFRLCDWHWWCCYCSTRWTDFNRWAGFIISGWSRKCYRTLIG